MASSPVVVRAHGEVRGTQTFVQVMAAVWRRPGLVGLEVTWRWIFSGLAWAALWPWAKPQPPLSGRDWNDFGSALWNGRFGFDWKPVLIALAVLLAAWSVAAAGMGRRMVVRRLEPSLRASVMSSIQLAFLRSIGFATVAGLWVAAGHWLMVRCVWQPLAARAEPEYVAGFVGLLLTTLLLFVVWALVSWPLRLAPLLAAAGEPRPLRAAWTFPLRGKLIEINLVMGIVKIALIVLAMVFSATPLPFESYTSDAFLDCWWVGLAVLYLLASDYFHVVRTAAYLAMWRATREASDGQIFS